MKDRRLRTPRKIVARIDKTIAFLKRTRSPLARDRWSQIAAYQNVRFWIAGRATPKGKLKR